MSNVKQLKGSSSCSFNRFIASIWATFAVVFLAIYTANLAAFMITREEFYDLSGVEDPRVSSHSEYNFLYFFFLCFNEKEILFFSFKLINPMNYEPPFRFGTVVNTHTEATIMKHYKDMHYHMRNYNLNEIVAGIDAVKRG